MSSNEIDIQPIIEWINKCILWIREAIDRVEKKKWWFVLILGLSVAGFYYQERNKAPQYNSVVTVSTPAIAPADAIRTLFELKNLVQSNNNNLLASELGLGSSEVSSLKDMEYFGQFDEDFNPKKLPKHSEPFKIQIRYEGNIKLLTIQNGLAHYFNHHTYLLEKQFETEQAVKFEITLIENQLRVIDELLDKSQTKDIYGYTTLQEHPSLSFLERRKELQMQLVELRNKQQLFQKGILHIVHPFQENLASITRISYKKIAMKSIGVTVIVLALLLCFPKIKS